MKKMSKTSRFLSILAIVFCLVMALGITAFAAEGDTETTAVAKVGNTEYATIDEAIANWTNGTTLTLLDNVTLSDVVTLKSTESHTLNLGTYTMTAASGKHAIEITCEGRSSASYALTVNADATNPGGINAPGKSCIYYKKSGSTKDRPIILINNGVFTGSYSLNLTSNGNTNCPQIWITGGTFNSYMNLTKCMLKVSGGTFHAAINCTGDSSAYREIKGGRFKSWQFMTADAANKFWVGSGNGNYDVGVYVDSEGYLVVGGPVIKELSAKYPAVATNYSKWSTYLKYSSAATYGLFYEDPAMATAKHGTDNVTVWKPAVNVDENVEVSGEKGEVVLEEIANNTALKGNSEKIDITLTKVEGTTATYEVTVDPDPNESSVEFRLPIPASVTEQYVKVYKTTLTRTSDDYDIYEVKVEGNAKYIDVVTDTNAAFTVEPADVTPVAKIGDNYYETLVAAISVADKDTEIVLLSDVEEEIGSFVGKFVTDAENGVTITNTYTGWTGFDNVTVGENVTVKSPLVFSSEGENVINGTLVVGEGESGTYYHAYDAKTTVADGGKVVVNGTTILRYNKVSDAGIYVYGDGDNNTVEYDCAYYLGAYSGTFYAEDATVEFGYVLLKNSYDNATYADAYMTLDNTVLTVVGTTDTQDSFHIDDQVHLVLSNNAKIADVRDFNILAGANIDLSVDSTSTISATYMNVNANVVGIVPVQNADGTYSFAKYLIMVSYPNGTVEYYNDMLDAVPYTTNCPRLEGATITLLGNCSGAGMRFMENDMVFDLNGFTYTITAGTGSQGTNTSGFQIRPEVTTSVIFKNGTINVAEGAPVVWMFNVYATDFIVENVTVDCANMAWSYENSFYVVVSRSGDNVQFVGNTNVKNFDSNVAGVAYNIGGTMTVGENAVLGGAFKLSAGATLDAPAGLTVATDEGYIVVYNDGVYAVVEAVAKVGGVYYATLSEAFTNVTSDTQDVIILKDVTENLTGAYLRGNITTENGEKVTITLTNTDWVYCPYTFVIGENITLNVPKLFYYAGGSVINGTVVAGVYYQRYAGTKLTINEPGSLTVTSETCIIRYMDGDPNAGIYINGDNDDTTIGLKLVVAYFYQGMIYAKDANIECAVYWQTNETDGQGTANLVLDNSTLTVTVNEHNAKATGNSTVTLKNHAKINAAGGFEYNDSTTVKVDKTSSIIANGNLVNVGLKGSGTAEDPYQITSLKDLILFRDSVNAGEDDYNAAGVYVVLTADIDLAGENWVAIGSAYIDHGFMGNFDGNGFKIKNLTIINPAIDSDGYVYAGFFGVTEGTDKDNQNFIKNLVIENVTIETSGHIVAAAIAYPYYTALENITVCGNIAIKGGNYTAGVLAYTRRCVNASNLTVAGNAGSYITGASTVGGVLADLQMNGGLVANYSNFKASNVTVTGSTCVGGISGIIAKQTLTGATVENVALVCDDARVGIVAGSLGETATVTGVTATNVTGATATVGASYDSNYIVVNNGNVYSLVTPVASVNGVKYATLEEAFKAATSGCTIEILADVTVDYKWDARYTGAKFTVPVTINGNNKTIKFIGTVNDNNWNTVFRFEENAVVNNLTVDISEATGAQRVISAKKSLTVDGLVIKGAARYGIIFGEGASAADLAATEIVIKNSDLNGTRRAISDNEGGKDVKSITVTGNTLKANVYLSASDSVVFNNNVANGEVDIRSYAKDDTVLSVEAKGNTLTEGVKNYIFAKNIDAQSEFETKNPPIKVATKAELNAALAAAKDGDVIVLTADIDYGTDQLALAKAITLDLGGNTLTTRNAFGGMSVKNNATVKNGTIVHASNTAAIKVWNATAFENLVIDVQGKGDANKTIGGIVLQSGSTTRVGSIKNVTIKGAALTNGIETYNCGDATENVIGSMENVTITAQGTGMLISAPCGTATNCTISGGTNAIEIWIKGNYSASLDLVDSTVEGGVYAHDEFNTNPGVVNNGTLNFTVDEATTVNEITLELARAENVGGELKEIKDNAQAKVNNVYYATLAEAMAAAKAGDVVTVFAGTYAMPSMKAGITIVGEGEVIFEGTLTGTLENLTLKNIYIKGGNAQRWAYAKGDLVFENVTFHATSVYALHFDRITAGANLTYKDCTIIGWAAMSGSPESVVFDSCTFKGNGTYGLIRTYFDATLTNCTFDVANVNTTDNYQDGIHAVSGAVVKVENCKNKNGDMIDLVNVNATSVVVLDGVEIKNVAKVGDNYYRTLAEAIAAAQTGDTVTLLTDLTVAATKGGYSKAGVIISGEILDGNGHTLTVTGANDTYGCGIYITGGTVKNLKVKGAFRGIFTAGASSDIYLDNVSFENVVYTFNSDDGNGQYGVYISNSTINGWTSFSNVHKEVVFTNCSFGKGSGYAFCRPYNTTVFNGCTFSADYEVDGTKAQMTFQNMDAESVAALVDGAAAIIVRDNGIVTYVTLADAFAAANDGETIKLLGNIAMSEGITNTKKVTLDLNGKTITGTDNATASFGLITNKGELTITGNGKMTLVATNNRGWNAYSSVISNTVGGKLVVENGTIEHLGGTDMAYAIDNLTNGKGTYAATIINGGTIKSTYRAIRQFLNGVEAQNILTVNGGIIEGANKSIWMQDPSKNANTGKLTVGANAVLNGDVYLFVTAGSTEWPVEVSIAAAAVNGEVVTGNLPNAHFVENVNGAYVNFKAVASVNGTNYETLAAAIAAANAGDTITLVANVTENVTLNKNLTIDGAEFNYTGTMTINNVNVTIQNVNFVKGQVYKNKSTGSTAKITIKNCDFDGQGLDAYAINLGGTNSIVLENVTAMNYGYGMLQVPSSCAGLTVKNVTVSGCYYGIKIDYANAVALENVIIDATIGIYDSNYGDKTYTIKDSTISSIKIWERSAAKTTTFAFKGVNTVTTLSDSDYAKYEGVQIGTTIYGTLAEAWADAQDGDTITLLGNIEIDTETFNVAAGTKVTLNLNGKTITVTDNSTANYELFYIQGEMVVTGNGTIELTATVNRAWNAMSAIFHNRGGVLTIENGTFTHKGGTDMAYVVDNSGNWTGVATTNIYGGTLTSTYTAIRNRMDKAPTSSKVILNVYGGTINGGSRAIWAQASSTDVNNPALGLINISGGNIGYIYTSASAGAVSMTTITGGTVASFKGESGELTVNGGSITGKIEITFANGNVAPAYVLNDNVYYAATASYNGKYYTTLQEAIDAAAEGKYVYLLCDTEGTGIVINKDIKIQFNGYIYTFIGDAVGSANTKTNGFQILKGNNVFLYGGTLKVADSAADKYAILIQNYANLTIKNMTLDGTNLDYSDTVSYVLSINCGNVDINNSTTIIANDRNLAGDYAIDVYDYSSAGYDLPTLTLGSQANVDVTKVYAAAKNGKIYYATLQQAIDAGSSAELLCDYEGAGVVINKDFRLNLAGKTFTITEGVGSANTKTNGFQLLKGNKITISNGTIKVADSAANKIAILIQNYADLTLSNVTLDGTNLDYSANVSYVLSVNSGNVKVNAGSKLISNDRNGTNDWALDVYDYSSAGYTLPVVQITNDVTINGVKATVSDKIYAAARYSNYYYASLQQCIDAKGTAYLVCDYAGPGVVFNKNATVYFEGHTYTFTSGVGSKGTETNGFQILAGNKVTLVNGTLKVAESAADKMGILIQNYANLSLQSMTLCGDNLNKASYSYTLSNNSGNVTIDKNCVICANTEGNGVAFDVYADKNYELPMVKVAKGATIVGKIEAAAKYDSETATNVRYYATLDQALADRENASSKDNLILMSNIVLEDTLVIPAGKAIVLDLNGFTISQEKACTGHYAMIVNNNGAWTIMDSSEAQTGKITFKDTGKGDASFGWGSYTIENKGQLILKSGTLENATTLNSKNNVVHMYCVIQQNTDTAHTQLLGGSVINETYRSIRINRGKLTVGSYGTTEKGATVVGQVWIQAFAEGISVSINNGTFTQTGVDASAIYVENSTYSVAFKIWGGTFNGKIGCANADALKGCIRAGVFTDKAYADTKAELFHKNFVR